jgi:hypothetical protein
MIFTITVKEILRSMPIFHPHLIFIILLKDYNMPFQLMMKYRRSSVLTMRIKTAVVVCGING